MSIRIIFATFLLFAAGLLGGCASESSASDPKPAPSSETEEAVADLVGSWHDPNVNWTVHFHDDGTFTEDFQGNTDMRSGDFTVEKGVVTLIGGDGNNNSGTIKDETIEFRLGTLTRMTE